MPTWLGRCTRTVRAAALAAGWEYRMLGDELFAPVPPQLAKLSRQQRSDIGRLHWILRLHAEGYDTVTWVDADIMVGPGYDFDPHGAHRCAVEVQLHESGRVFNRINNSIMGYARGSQLLEVYLFLALAATGRGGWLSPCGLGADILVVLHAIGGWPLYGDLGHVTAPLHAMLGGQRDIADYVKLLPARRMRAIHFCNSTANHTMPGALATAEKYLGIPGS